MPRSRAPLAVRLKTLGTQHVEKLAFALCLMIAAGFLWSSLTSEVYSFSPEELVSGAKIIEGRMNGDDPGPPLPPGPGPFGIPPLDGDYGFDQPWFRYPVEQVVRVRTLQLLPLENLKASFGRAPFQYTRVPPAPVRPVRGAPVAQAPVGPGLPQGDFTEGRRYVVLTGLIPWRDQQEIFDRLPLFHNMPASKNELRYEGFVVERAEVRPATPDTWQVLDLQSLSDEIARWTREQPEFADDLATLPGMAVPLAPRVVPWTAAEVVPQGIPLRGEREEVQVDQPVRPRRPFHPWNPQQAINNRNVVQAAPRQAVGLPNRMFRVFDFTVEPEKQYRYRVRLVVQNPNFGMHPGFLKSPDLAKNSFELAPASLPSDALSIPRDWQLLTGPYKPASPALPGEVRMGVEIWDPATGADAVGMLRVNLGQVLNTNLKVRYRNPLAIDREQPPLEKELKLTTGTMLVDVFEDVLLPKERPNAPRVHACEVLLLESSGNLQCMSTAASLERVRQIEKEFELPLTAEARE